MTALARMKVPLFKDFGNAQGFVTFVGFTCH